MQTNEFIISLVINLIIAIIVSIITAKLSIKGFHKQEIWLRKEKKYSFIISSLILLQKHSLDVLESLGNSNDINFTYNLNKMYKTRKDLELLSLSPSFILDENISIILKELLDKTAIIEDDDVTYYEFYDVMYDKTRIAITEIDKLAHKDLKINSKNKEY